MVEWWTQLRLLEFIVASLMASPCCHPFLCTVCLPCEALWGNICLWNTAVQIKLNWVLSNCTFPTNTKILMQLRAPLLDLVLILSRWHQPPPFYCSFFSSDWYSGGLRSWDILFSYFLVCFLTTTTPPVYFTYSFFSHSSIVIQTKRRRWKLKVLSDIGFSTLSKVLVGLYLQAHWVCIYSIFKQCHFAYSPGSNQLATILKSYVIPAVT